jgi:uncharacterized protein (DUF885 family)
MNMLKPLFLFVTLIYVCNASAQYTLEDIITEYQSFNENESKLHQTQWPDVTNEVIKNKKTVFSRWISTLSKLDTTNYSTTNRINYEMLYLILDDELFSLSNNHHLMPLNSEGGFIINMIYYVRGLNLKTEKSISNYQEKLNTTPKYIEQQINNLKAGQKSNMSWPKVVVENCINVLDDLLKNKGEKFFLYQPFLNSNVDVMVDDNFYNTFIKFRKYLKEEYLPNAPKKVGISNITNGKSYYEQSVRYFTTLDMTPQEVYDIGQSEVRRIKSEMTTIINDLNYSGSYSDFLNYLRTDQQFYADTPEELLHYAAWLSKKAEEILPQYFSRLPSLPFTVSPVPAEIAPNYTTGRYSGGSMESQKAGAYWVNTYNLPARPLYVLPALTLHEAVPGHHLQISLAKELLDSLPEFRSQYLSAYGEGWGLYAEYLGKEAGIYESAYQDFGRLTYEMWRACRLVVDPGMHYFGWTKQEAVDFMKENAALSEHEIETEINRYIGWPGQAVSYKIGELKIRELRAMAEKELEDKFDIREFHDLVLANGSIPLTTLERIVNNYIIKKKSDAEKN